MNDHKPNRRQRRAMQRIGDKMADRIFKQQAIKKVKRDDTEKETHQGAGEVPTNANDRQREPDAPGQQVRMDTGATESDN